MASLTESSIIARRVIRYSVYTVILLVIGRFSFITGQTIYKRLFPAPPPPPTCGFGKLPEISFPTKPGIDTELSNLSFNLETQDGQLPNLPDQTQVFFMQPFSASLGDLDKAKEKAQKLGYSPEGRIEVENVKNVYTFERTDAPSRFTIDIVSGVFSIYYDLSADPRALSSITFTPEVAADTAKGYLTRAQLSAKDLEEGPTSTELLRLDQGSFVKTDAIIDAQAVKVNFFRKSYNDFPSVTSEADQANVWFILASGNTVIRAEHNYFPIDDQKVETYPLLEANNGWEQLKNGQAYIANSGGHESGDTITIRRVYLGYYDPRSYLEFFQPVLVFDEANENGDSFVAYVPAVVECN